MNKIKILDESVSNIIAAGEVVENPASMIKELIENSLDAKAKTIRVEVKNSGRDVRLVDTGIGMEKEDLFLCVERHATSKIKEKEDLFNLISYGFRGEALASIGSISKMIISTKTETSKIGHKINLNAGRVTKYEEISKVVGTEISIKDLFFNTPARLKFLRKKSTEYARIREIVLKEALYNCDVSFILVLDGREVVKTSGRGMENVILELFGRLTLKNSNKFSLGYWGNMELLKSNKESIYTFVNGRYVKSKTIEKAILDGYYTKLTKGKYPFAIIFFDISPEKVDVNVHPSKKIVKFVDEEGVYKEVLSQISEAIYSNDRDSSKTLTVEEISNNIIVKNDVIKTNQGTFELIDTNKVSNNENRTITPEEHIENPETLKNKVLERIAKASQNSYDEKEYSVPIIPSFDWSTPDTEQIEEVQSEYSEKVKIVKEAKDIKSKEEFLEDQVSIGKNEENKEIISKNIQKKEYKVLAQLHNMYILVETEHELEIYDQHIVHERILYEKLKEDHYNKKISIQNLLVPIKLEFTGYEIEIIRGNLDLFNEFGFEVEEFGDDEVLIRGVPIFNFRVSVEETFRTLLEDLGGGDPREKVLISMSCRNAIKAGEKLTFQEMDKIIGELHKIGKYTCPHGRPIILKMTFDEMNKKFNRK